MNSSAFHEKILEEIRKKMGFEFLNSEPLQVAVLLNLSSTVENILNKATKIFLYLS